MELTKLGQLPGHRKHFALPLGLVVLLALPSVPGGGLQIGAAQALLVSPSSSAPTWTNITSTVGTPPSPRTGSEEVFDATDGYFLVYGGTGPQSQLLSDTWKFSSGTWFNITATAGGPANTSGPLVYDQQDGYVLAVFHEHGACGHSCALTWKFQQGQWTNLSATVTGAPPLASNGPLHMADDPADGYVVARAFAHTTWKYYGGVWTNITGGAGEGSPVNGLLAWDPVDDFVVEINQDPNFGLYTVLWTFSQGTWTNRTSQITGGWPAGPEAMVFDPIDGYLVVLASDAGARPSTWEFVHDSFTELCGSSPSCTLTYGTSPGLGFDNQTRQVILFGGDGYELPLQQSTWAFSGGTLTYTVKFAETGLTSGTTWTVVLGGASFNSVSTSLSATESDGTYSFSVGGVSGCSATPAHGNLTVNGAAVSQSVSFTCSGGGGATLQSVSVSPSSGSVSVGATTSSFSAAPTCSSTCPGSGIVYAWTSNQPSLGTVNSPSAESTTYTAGAVAGSLSLFVNATLNGKTVEGGPAAVTITTVTAVSLTGVTITPSSDSVPTDGSVTFVATPGCSSTCPSGATYSWTVTNSLGALSASSGSSVTFTAGGSAGGDTIFVNATLNGVTKQSAPITITISSSGGGSGPGSLGSSSLVTYLVVAGVVVVVAVLLLLVYRRRRGSGGKSVHEGGGRKAKDMASEEASVAGAETPSEPSTSSSRKINRFSVLAVLEAARASKLGLPEDSAFSWGLSRARSNRAERRGTKVVTRGAEYRLGDALAFRDPSSSDAAPIFTFDGENQSAEDFRSRISTRFGSDANFRKAWAEAQEIVSGVSAEDLRSASGFKSTVYELSRDDLVEKWAREFSPDSET